MSSFNDDDRTGTRVVCRESKAADRQYSFCLWIMWTKSTRILTRSTWEHRVLHSTCIQHGRNIKTLCMWVDTNLAQKKGLEFYQTRSNGIIFQGTLPACCIPKVVRLKIGEVLFEKSYMSPRPPPKISLRHDWTRGEVLLGSTVDQQPVGKLVRQSR